MKPLLILAFLAAFTGCNPKPPDYIVVKGVGSVTVPIDYVTIGVTIRSKHTVLKTSYENNQKIVLKMFDIFKSYSIADTDFVTLESDTRTAEGFDYRSKPEEYFALYSGLLTLRDIQRYDDIVRSLLGLGNVEISLRKMGSNDMDGYRKKAYANAVENATSEAQYLVAGSSHRLGKILKLLQDNQDSYEKYDYIEQPQKVFRRELSARLEVEIAEAPPKGPLTFRRKDFQESASVTVIYELN